jgi:hypothetical protein
MVFVPGTTGPLTREGLLVLGDRAGTLSRWGAADLGQRGDVVAVHWPSGRRGEVLRRGHVESE